MSKLKLRPVNNAELELVAAWTAQKENWQWLDFGNGQQILTSITLKIMAQRDAHFLRLFAPDSTHAPIGLVGLSNINRTFGTAMLWYVLGDKDYTGQGWTTRAVSASLSCGFNELGLRAVNAWAVEQNIPSVRVLERNNFRLIGRQRQCHYIDGRPCDRLLFDILASEHTGI